MKTQRLWINVYRSGHYHRQGKPGHCNIHAGDLFTSEDLALENAEPTAGYIATVPVDMPVQDGVTVLANPQGSEPTPLHQTRDNPLALMPWHTPAEPTPAILRQFCAMPGADDTAEDPLGMSYEEWRREQVARPRPAPQPQPHRVAALLRSAEF